MKQPGKAFGSGLAGAAVVTLLHESLKQIVSQAPRMDLLGMQAIQQLLNKNGNDVPQSDNKLYAQALGGDLLANSLYYSVAGLGKKPWIVGLIAGVGAGVAAVTVPKQLGLNEHYASRTGITTAMTIGLYAIGGLVAAGVASLLSEEKENKIKPENSEMKNKPSWNLKD